ncbi:MAG: M1 family aminopeptidase [Cyclobacteriaceae bacterium]
MKVYYYAIKSLMKHLYPAFTILILLMTTFSVAQSYNPNQLPNTYRSDGNPYYWKNKKPSADYWQQDVHYSMKAFIDDTNDVIRCSSYELVYWNNSPDTLNELFFHLYQNSFQPGSHMHNIYENNERTVSFTKEEAKGSNTTMYDIKVDGKAVEIIHDFSVVKVPLADPILPGDSAVVTMGFDTQLKRGSLRSRLKVNKAGEYKHFNGVHWYPAVAVYDRKFGWTTDQHLDKEFYNNFGTFDLELTFPQEYIVEATGNLLNKKEVLPDTLWEKLQLSNFKNKLYGSPASALIARKGGETKTWKYHAENVHNAVFTADPTYRIEELKWNGIQVIALAQESHASKWQESAEFTKKVIETYDRDFTEYIWPKIIVADAGSGMEYSMITLDGGTYPKHQGLLAHEVGHMWFYGMVGSNETYRAFMDEGFTQYLTVWSMERVTGERGNKETAKTRWINKRIDTVDYRYGRMYYGYLKYALQGYDHQLNTHSSGFRGAVRHGGGYGLVYYKTAVMLENLRYVLGEELFLKAMQFYVNRWKCAHPYPEDFRQAIVDYTKTDLNWFFDQWMETTKKIDYGIGKVKKTGVANEYTVEFKRKEAMQMPIDFTVTDKEGKEYEYHIPNTWFVKKTDATVLPQWYGWDNTLNPTYIVTIQLEDPIDQVSIDPKGQLADINKTDNRWKGNTKVSFDDHVKNYPKWDKKQHKIRPDVWYNSYDGIQLGVHGNTNYMKELSKLSYTVWWNSRVGQDGVPSAIKKDNQPIGLELHNRTSLYKLWDQMYFNTDIQYNAGLFHYKYGFEKIFRRQDPRQPEFTRVYGTMTFMNRANEEFREYLLYPSLWNVDQSNNWVTFGIERYYTYGKSNGRIDFHNRSSNGEANYGFQELESVNNNRLGKIWLRTRLFGRLGQRNAPLESALYLAGANPEQLYDSKFTRATGLVSTEWTDFDQGMNLQMGGGLNLRGYAGIGLTNKDSAVFYGTSGASFSAELEFDEWFSVKSKRLKNYLHLDTYLFGDVGALTYKNRNDDELFDQLRGNLGVGTAITIKFGPHLDITPLTLRVDIPFYVSGVKDEFKSRWVFGFGRAF